MSPMTRTNITLDDHTIRLIAEISTTTGASKSEIIRRGVVAYAEQVKKFLPAKKSTAKKRG